MEEADLRLAETKKASYEFERDIVKGSVNARTGRVIAEKVQRYLDDKLRARVSEFFLYISLTISTVHESRKVPRSICFYQLYLHGYMYNKYANS